MCKGQLTENEPKAEKVHCNLSASELMTEALKKREGVRTATGALRVLTGKYTGRSPKDKYVVKDVLNPDIAWDMNKSMSKKQFESLLQRARDYVEKNQVYVFDGYAGADPAYRLPIRVINQYAWQNLFARQLFIPCDNPAGHEPELTIYGLPGLKADPAVDGTHSEAFIVISFDKKVILIGGTEYAGEIKKSVFTVLNYFLPYQGVLPMHCSANMGETSDDVALFFGLSGTGKTTLSADYGRRLVGDDEHGWSPHGIFNFEGGCYAKCINLTREREPQIYNAIKDGAVLENVVLDPETGMPNFDDASITENTRVAYPLSHIPGAVETGMAGHPRNIIFLSADAFGVLPPVARLTREQAMYYFLSGYTSKLAGTERGINEPEATFSSCFGAPFLPLDPGIYAKMLGEKIDTHGSRVFLVNTGWTGGSYGQGKRMDLNHTRTIVRAILDGSIDREPFVAEPYFGLSIPRSLPGVPSALLNPVESWTDKEGYVKKARELAEKFNENFRRFDGQPGEIRLAGPGKI